MGNEATVEISPESIAKQLEHEREVYEERIACQRRTLRGLMATSTAEVAKLRAQLEDAQRELAAITEELEFAWGMV